MRGQAIWLYVVEPKLGPKLAFFESKFGPRFVTFLLVFFTNRLISAGK